MNHWGLFKQSFSILWQNRSLWVFGLLAALGGGGLNFRFGAGEVRPLTDLPPGGRELLRSWFGAIDFTALIVAGLVIGAITFVLSTFAEAALIGMVNSIAAGQPANLGDGARIGARRFLPLLLTRFLIALPLLLLGVLTAGSFFSAFSSLLNESDGGAAFGPGALGAFTGLGLLASVIGILTTSVSIGAERAVVLDEMPIGPAIARGWKLLWARLNDYVSIALIFLGLAIVIGIVLACALLPILFANFASNLAQLQAGVNVFTFAVNILGATLIVLVLLGLIVGSLVAVFVSSVWTLAYRHWQASAPTVTN
jgi:hypothetical protein